MATHTASRTKMPFIETALGEDAVATAYPPSKQSSGTILYDTSADVAYQIVRPGGTAAWKRLGGAGQLGKYFVSEGTPATGYTTIQAAIDAAVADGHDASNPTVVLVFPGAYAGFAMAEGVSVVGLHGTQGTQVSVTGNVTLAVAGTSTLALGNMAIAGQLLISGAGTPVLVLQNLQVVNSTGHAVLVTNTGVGIISFRGRCVLQATNGTSSAFFCAVAVAINATNAAFVAGSDDFAVVVGEAAAATFNGCDFTGAVSLAGVTRLYDCNVTVLGQYAYDTKAGATMLIRGGSISSDTGAFTGQGTVTPSGAVAYLGVGGPKATTSVLFGTESSTPPRKIQTATSGAVTMNYNADIVQVTPGGVATAVTLPAINTLPDGTERSIYSASTTGVVTATPAVADSIFNGVAGVGLALNGDRGFITVVSNRATSNWIVKALR